MIYDLRLAWRSLRNRPIQTLTPLLVVGLTIALSVTVIVLADGATEGIVQASDPFGVVVVGAPGSGQQLVLSSILLQGNPVGNIPYDVYEQLEADERTQLVVPLAFGDNVEGARLVGTNLDFFNLRTSQSAPPAFQIAEGRLFDYQAPTHDDDHADETSDDHADDEHEDDHADEASDEPADEADHADEDDHADEASDEPADEVDHADDDHANEASDEPADEADHADEDDHADEASDEPANDDHDHADEGVFEAVLGAEAANRLGLSINDTFKSAHGTGSVNIASDFHEDTYTVVGILAPSNTPYDGAVFTQLQSVWDAHAEDEDDLIPDNPAIVEASPAASTDQVTTIFVLPTGFIEQNQLVQEFYTDPTVQAVAPGDELVGVINLLNLGQQVLNIVGYIVLVIAALTVFLSIYSATVSRQQDIAIIRSMGGTRGNVFRMVIFESLLITIGGAILGRIIGYVVAFLIASVFSQQSAIPVPIRFLGDLEILLWVLTIGVGVLAGVLPALLAYRVDIVEKLFPT